MHRSALGFLRAGELTEVWVREPIRSREAAVDDLRRKRQAISSLMLRYGRSDPGKKTWGARTANVYRHSDSIILRSNCVESDGESCNS